MRWIWVLIFSVVAAAAYLWFARRPSEQKKKQPSWAYV